MAHRKRMCDEDDQWIHLKYGVLGKVRHTSWDSRKTGAQIGCAAYFLGKEQIFGFRLPENGMASLKICETK
nr:hypothetical protein [Tanacetum cinerariifolium]